MMKYEHILWCHEDNHDKVWGIIRLGEVENQKFLWNADYKYVTFWGRRGNKLQTKVWEGTEYEAQDLTNKKIKKGYNTVVAEKLNEVYPEFQEDLEKTTVWSILSA
jgi:predicted DNA-binding WGR domain protein